MGRIGKPQKSRKNKKIKSIDPFYVGDRKDSRIKFKDQKPGNEDTQEVPRKVRRLMETVADERKPPAEKRINKRKFHEKSYMHPAMTKPMESIPKFKQRKTESHYSFMSRVERETQAVLLQSKLEEKFKTKLERDEGGEIIVQKKGLSKKKKERLKNRKDKKKAQKQEKRQNKEAEFSRLTDKVEFGEVVSQPPLLTAKPRKSQTIHQTKPGQRSLLLKEIMSNNSSYGGTLATKRHIGQTVKRKHLTPAQQAVTDQDRQNAIDLYRQLKGKQPVVFDT